MVEALTQVHVFLSLLGIVAGVVALFGMLHGKRLNGWTGLFLLSTILTCLTGFLLPHNQLLPSDVVGIVSLVALTVAIVALYVRSLAGAWRRIYVGTAVLALYLNVFVGAVQAFEKIPVLRRLAPTQSEPPFLIAQVIVLVIFAGLGVLAVRRFQPPSPGAGAGGRRRASGRR